MKKIILALKCIFMISSALAQHAFTGTILSRKDKTPIAGASLYVIGSNVTAETNRDGQFTLPINKEPTKIEIISIGYAKKEISVKRPGKNQVVIYLQAIQKKLPEVMVSTGYQVIPKERSTGSFTHINNEEFNQQITPDVLSRLPAVANGVIMDKGTNETGKIMIRGLSTIRGPKEPLIILNNFPYDGNINNINPNDVEDITILKDAAAASIWGARAGNGVIVIKTKNGHYNQPLSIGFNANVTIGAKPDLSYIKQMSSSDFINVEKFLYNKGYYKSQINSSAKRPLSPVVEILLKKTNGELSDAEADAEINSLRNNDIRDQYNKYMYQNSVNQQYALNLHGGTSKISWFTSAGYDKDIDNLDAEYNRKSLNFRSEYRPVPKIQVSTNLFYTQSSTISGKPGYGNITSKGPYFFPYAQFADAMGNALPLVRNYRQSYIDTAGKGKLLDWQYYPLEDYNHTINKTSITDLIFNSGINFKILKGLNADVKYQYERQRSELNNLDDENSYYARNFVNLYSQINTDGTVTYAVPEGSILDYSNETLQSYNLRGQLNYQSKWDKNKVIILLGGEIRSSHTTAIQDRIYGYNSDNLSFGNVDYTRQYPTFVNGSLSYIQDNRDIEDKKINYISVYANGAYTFDSKYTLSLSGRRDASNIFGLNTNDQWNPFWSGGLSWNISDEAFYNATFLPYLKLRATYGLSGNINSSMTAVTTIAYLSQPSPYTNLAYSRFDHYKNPDLKWETSKMVNIGLDFGLANNIITGSIEYYRKRGVNLFGTAPLDYTSGIGATVVKNVASMKGSGWDIELKSTNTKGTVNWRSVLNFSYYNSEVTDYYLSSLQASRFISTNAVFPITGVKGYPVYSIFGYKWAGLDPQTGDPMGYLDGHVSKDYTTLTGTNTLISDLKYFGSAIPTFFGSFLNTFSYKGLSLSIDIVYKLGYYFRRTSINYSNLFSNWEGHSDYKNRWQKPGDELKSNIPSLIYPASRARDNFYTGSAALVDKGDHIRLQYIYLNYDLTKYLTKKRYLKTLQVYLNINNLGIIWRANKNHIDPDYNYGLYPLIPPTTYSFGVKVDL